MIFRYPELLWLPLLAVPLLLRALWRRPVGEERWSTRVDVPLALAVGVAAALFCGLWMVRFSMRVRELTASDFDQYCVAVDLLRAGGDSSDPTLWPGQRSVAAGVLAGWLAGPFGIVNALVLAAFLSVAASGAAVYLWARSVGGRLAGLCAALGLGAVGPISVLTRTVTFYPTTIAGFVLSSAAATAAVRWPTVPALFLAGVGIAAALLLDVRGLLWALPALCVSLVAAFIGPWRGTPARLVALAAPVIAAWFAGPWAFPEHASSLEQQVSVWADDALRRVEGTELLDEPPRGFIWGRSDLREVPDSLAWLSALPARLPKGITNDPEMRLVRHSMVGPWLPLLAVAAALVLVFHARRRPLVVLALVGTLAPFLVSLRGATTVLGHTRFVATSLMFMPVLVALAYEALATRRAPPQAPDAAPAAPVAPWPEAARLALGVGAFLLLVLGIVPSWLSPIALWRVRIEGSTEPTSTLAAADDPNASTRFDPRCLAALRRDRDAGKGLWMFVSAPEAAEK
ncbi:MAG: hypothetical protein Q8P18_16530 [Pseudomonadota bacterium]|nr:hypothetical protein [Pseudomonadota bacterium]